MGIQINSTDADNLGDNHIGTSSDTPIRDDAFLLNHEEKIEIIKDDVKHIMETLGLDLTDDSLRGTPNRVAKMFVNEIFSGLDPEKKPKASTFQNKYNYGEMLVEKKYYSLFNLRTSFTPNCWKSACGLYFKWNCRWIIQNE